MLDALPFGVCVVDPAGTIRLINREGGRMLGWQADECQGRNLHELIGCRLAQPLSEQTCPLAAVLRTGAAVPLLPAWVRDRYDRMMPVQCGVSPLVGTEAGLLLFAFHDLREQLQRDEALLHLATMPEEAPYPIVELNEDGSLLYANPAMARLLDVFGYTETAFPRLLPCEIGNIARTCLRMQASMGGLEVAVEGAWYSWTFCPIAPLKRIRGYAVDLTAIRGAEHQLEASLRKLEIGNRALDEARRMAEVAMQAKGRLLATMTHELRTPIAGITGMAEFLLDTALTSEQRQYAETVLHSSQALLHVIHDVLDASTLDAGKVQLEEKPFDLISVIEAVTELMAEEAARKGVELAALAAPDVPTMVCGDAGRLRQILVNLVGNALKFCDIGEVVIGVQRDSGDRSSSGPHAAPLPITSSQTLRFTVSDTGIGIPAESRDRVFDAYERVESDGMPGAGLGLHISRQLVTLMGGHIGVESRPAEGSRFWFTARVGMVAPDHPAPPTALRGKRMLIVEDHEATRVALQQQAMAWEMECEESASGQAALTHVRQARQDGRPYHLILVDLTLPDMSGLDLAEALRPSAGDDARVILLTAFGGRIHEDVARTSGLAAQIMKPIRRAHLFRCLTTLLATAIPAAPASPQTAVAPLTPLRVLVVEDHPVNQTVAVKILEKLGCRADVAGNGASALSLWERTPYDAVLMDCAMPVMDGYETTRRIREAERLHSIADRTSQIDERSDESISSRQSAICDVRSAIPHVPIIALTANASEGHLERCIGAGMDDFLTKPMSLEALDACLRRWAIPVRSPAARSRPH